MRFFVAGLAILAACLPLSVLATVLLLPLWSWLESRYGIESVGHSGPAEWCFLLTYGVCVAAASGGYGFLGGLRRQARPGSRPR